MREESTCFKRLWFQKTLMPTRKIGKKKEGVEEEVQFVPDERELLVIHLRGNIILKS